jgi:hypothetical protein
MNIFFLSLLPDECAKLYCDQHVIKILLEIVQMLYTAWHTSGSDWYRSNAPYNRARTQRGYRPSHAGHPMCQWVRENYRYAACIGMALAIEYKRRFKKTHACAEHVLWLVRNPPPGTPKPVSYSAKTYLSKQGIPECMPEEHWNPDIVKAYRSYYRTKTFARWTVVRD